jgi:hypothetical protein
MRVLSPVEAIQPAWDRAWGLVLKQPFRAKRAWKLGLVAIVAAMGGSPGVHLGGLHSHNNPLGAGVAAALAVVALFSALLFTGVGLVLFYLGSRMQFVVFEIAATAETTVAPKWNRYGTQTWRWIGLKLLYFLLMCAVLVVAAIPFIVRIIQLIRSGTDLDSMEPMAVVHLVLGMLGLLLPVIVAAVLLCIGYYLLHDFVLPVLALENVGIFEATGCGLRAVFSQFWMLVGYILMRIVLCIGMSILAGLAVFAAVVVAAIPLAPIAAALYYGLHSGGAGAMALMVCGFVVEGLVLLVWLVLFYLVVLAFVSLFYQSYALYYMGGLYEPLGNLLEPPAAPVEAAPLPAI